MLTSGQGEGHLSKGRLGSKMPLSKVHMRSQLLYVALLAVQAFRSCRPFSTLNFIISTIPYTARSPPAAAMEAAADRRAKCTLTGPILKAIVNDHWYQISQMCIDGSDEDVVENNAGLLAALAEHTTRLTTDPVATAIKEVVPEMTKSQCQRYALVLSKAMSFCLNKKRRGTKKLSPSVSRVVAVMQGDLIDDASPCQSEASAAHKNSDAASAAAASPRSVQRSVSTQSILAVYGVTSPPRASTASKAPIDLLSPMTVQDSQPAGTPSPKRKLDR